MDRQQWRFFISRICDYLSAFLRLLTQSLDNLKKIVWVTRDFSLVHGKLNHLRWFGGGPTYFQEAIGLCGSLKVWIYIHLFFSCNICRSNGSLQLLMRCSVSTWNQAELRRSACELYTMPDQVNESEKKFKISCVHFRLADHTSR